MKHSYPPKPPPRHPALRLAESQLIGFYPPRLPQTPINDLVMGESDAITQIERKKVEVTLPPQQPDKQCSECII
jgi:hypothetical protein